MPRWVHHSAHRLPALVLFTASLLFGCGRPGGRLGASAGEARRLPGGSGSASVTYQANTHLLKRAEGLSLLKGASHDGSTLLLDAKDRRVASLKAGDVLLIQGLLVRKVLAVEPRGSRLAALTRQATLGEAIQQGHIRLSAPIRFTPRVARLERRPGLERLWDRLTGWSTPALHAQSPDAERLKKAEADGHTDAALGLAKSAVTGVFEGWETTFSATPGAGRLDLSLTLKRNVGGFRALITGQGYLTDFDLSSGIDVERGIVEQLELAHKKLNGVMNFKWEVAKDDPGPLSEDDRIKLPAAASIPLYQYLEGFPLYLEISSALIIKPAISGGKEYSRGAFRITYDGYQSFQAKAGNIDANGSVTGDIAFVESQNISAMAPMGMVVAFAAPRLELTFGVSRVVDMEDIETAADAVDGIAEGLVKRTFGEEGWERWKNSPAGGVSMGQAAKKAVSSDAAGYLELVTSSGMSNSGMSAIFPCTRTDLNLTVKVGASAQAFGLSLGRVEQEIFKKAVTRVDPPGTKLCENAGG
jgi:hypothetical protein